MSNQSNPSFVQHTRPSTDEPERQEIIRETVKERISNSSFNQWYHEQQWTENILEGQPYLNGATAPPDQTTHTPSRLSQCHRKIRYREENAPNEGASPEGLFWIGEEFEQGIVVPYLQSVATTEETYVRNSVWFQTEIQSEATAESLRLKGTTDPVLTDQNGEPLFVTEIKSTSDVSGLTDPKPHHKAKIHAYLYGLNQEYEHQIQNGMILYGSRDTLDIRVFYIEFDAEFWSNTVVEWMETQTKFREEGSLPPAEPKLDWECGVCSYRHRCGQADSPYSDYGPGGLLPVFTGYRRWELEEYLDAYAEAGAKLTPTLASKFPDLAAEYGAYEWHCAGCDSTFVWDSIDSDNSPDPPVCPVCINRDDFVRLSGPEPADQLLDEE